MIRIFSQRRSQIRGVDFTVAMIIFMLTMMNVLVVTNNLISDSTSTSKVEIQGNAIDRTLKTLISTSGSPNWNNLDSATLATMNWSIGLQSDGNNDLNDLKLNRLSQTNIPEYLLSYQEIGNHLPSQGKVYRLETFSPLNNSILSITPIGTDLRIVGIVTLNDNPLQNTNITIHLISLGLSGVTTVQTVFSSTNSTGYYDDLIVGILPANFVGVLSFADFLGTVQDYSFGTYQDAVANFQRTNSTILGSSTGSPNTIDLYVEKEPSNSLSHVWALYPGGKIGEINSTEISQSSFNSTPATYTLVPGIVIPPAGTVGIFSLQISSFTTGYFSIDVLPTFLDGDIERKLEPIIDPNAVSSISTISVVIREVVVFIRLTVWEVDL